MPNVHATGKISLVFTFFLKGNLGVAVCAAKKPEQRCDDACRCLTAPIERRVDGDASSRS